MIVLTGGAGFIGSNLFAALSKENHKIIVVDNLNNELKNENLKRGLAYQYYDKATFLLALPTLQGITAILHQGACSSTTETNEAYLQENNVAYSQALLHYSIEKNIPFIYASSAAVYGDGTLGFNDNSNEYLPINGYAKSKLTFDKYVSWVLEKKRPQNKIIGLRYFNVYGYGEAHKGAMSSVVYKFYSAYKAGNAISLFEGSDIIKRDFIYVGDVVNVNLYCLQNELSNGIYNVGTGLADSFQNIANVFSTSYTNVIIKYIPFPEELKGKYQFYTQATMDKLRKQGYTQNFFTVNEGVNKYLDLLETNGAA